MNTGAPSLVVIDKAAKGSSLEDIHLCWSCDDLQVEVESYVQAPLHRQTLSQHQLLSHQAGKPAALHLSNASSRQCA
jgi:hypothetical protein